MNRKILFCMLSVIVAGSISSCKPKCQKCHVEIMGAKSPAQEYCGDQLKAAQNQPGIVCGD